MFNEIKRIYKGQKTRERRVFCDDRVTRPPRETYALFQVLTLNSSCVFVSIRTVRSAYTTFASEVETFGIFDELASGFIGRE